MATAYSMTTRAPGPSLLIIEKQQDLWDEQQPALESVVTIKQCLLPSWALTTASEALKEPHGVTD